MSITSATARRSLLNPAMDARALNQREGLLLHNPGTPEIDSLAEFALTAQGAQLVKLTRGIIDVNTREGLREMLFAGAADQLVTDLRRVETNGRGAREALNAKGIARALREPLRTLVDKRAEHLVDAAHRVAQVLRDAPSAQVLSPTVRYELGEAKFALLARLVEDRDV